MELIYPCPQRGAYLPQRERTDPHGCQSQPEPGLAQLRKRVSAEPPRWLEQVFGITCSRGSARSQACRQGWGELQQLPVPPRPHSGVGWAHPASSQRVLLCRKGSLHLGSCRMEGTSLQVQQVTTESMGSCLTSANPSVAKNMHLSATTCWLIAEGRPPCPVHLPAPAEPLLPLTGIPL